MSVQITNVTETEWPTDSAVAWDNYLREFVEVCEPGTYPGTITCRRMYPVPNGLGGYDEDGTMMPLPVAYFEPRTLLARELLRIASSSLLTDGEKR